MDRRTYLELVGAAGALGVAGCLSTDDEAGTAAPEESQTPTSTDTPATGSTDAGTPTPLEEGTTTDMPAPTPVPQPESTPAPGECAATDPPMPATGDGLPGPRSYPEKPDDITESAVRSFLEAYESAHRFNRELAELAADGTCVEYLDAPSYGSTVTAVEDGVTGTVETRASYTGTPCSTVTGTDSPTPLPHADLVIESARYYVTDRFLIREGIVLECWG
jgi:hypothetical protein